MAYNSIYIYAQLLSSSTAEHLIAFLQLRHKILQKALIVTAFLQFWHKIHKKHWLLLLFCNFGTPSGFYTTSARVGPTPPSCFTIWT